MQTLFNLVGSAAYRVTPSARGRRAANEPEIHAHCYLCQFSTLYLFHIKFCDFPVGLHCSHP